MEELDVADVLRAIADQAEELDGPFERVIVRQASPNYYVARVYPTMDDDYESYHIRSE